MGTKIIGIVILILTLSCQDNSEEEMRLFQSTLTGAEGGGGLPPLPANGVRVYLLTGQSNAVGRASNSSATTEELAPQTHFNIWNPTAGAFQNLDVGTNNLGGSGDHSIELGLASNIEAYYPDETEFYMIKYAVSGTEINKHLDGGVVYNVFWQYVQNGINNLIGQGKIPYVYLIYSQGERDANPITDASGSTPTAHFAKFGTWIDLWRTNIGADLPIVAYETLNFYSGSLEVNANMLAYEDLREDYHMLPMVSETDIGDGLHFDYQAHKNASIKALDFFNNYNGQPITTTLP